MHLCNIWFILLVETDVYSQTRVSGWGQKAFCNCKKNKKWANWGARPELVLNVIVLWQHLVTCLEECRVSELLSDWIQHKLSLNIWTFIQSFRSIWWIPCMTTHHIMFLTDHRQTWMKRMSSAWLWLGLSHNISLTSQEGSRDLCHSILRQTPPGWTANMNFSGIL